MKKLIAALVLAVTLSFGIFGINAYANTEGEVKPVMFLCKEDGAMAILKTVTNKESTQEDMRAEMTTQKEANQCIRLLAPVEVTLVERIASFVDFNKDSVELWRIELVQGSTDFDIFAFYLNEEGKDS